ncbi:MAG: putative ABC-type transport system involved in lysophospholipase biosynthesis, permease component [Frankiales bacterium]|nr:putative ABC-type transport system involved in lysophospholipase biosynthesis, permease component [Frankiales bacterium]
MVTGLWLRGLWRRRAGRMAASAAGITIAVALLASLGGFLASSKATMTARAVHGVAVDWQIQVRGGADPNTILQTVRAEGGLRPAVPVGFATADGLSAATGGTTQSTGSAVVLGLPPGYRTTFPGEIRTLTGSADGVLLAQQTAANLHVAPGDTVQVRRAGLAPILVRVDGLVDLPQANSLFQVVGAPAGSQPSAPPDNVLLLPADQWQAAFGPLAAARPDLVSTQIHAMRTTPLPSDPAAAYTSVMAAARHLEAATSGVAVVGDNLAASLGAARQDAAYAQALFLFLGLPGAVLAGLLTGAVSSAGAVRRRREQALLRIRGASGRQLLVLSSVEAATIGVAGAAIGLAAAAVVGRVAFGTFGFGTSLGSGLLWAGGAALAGLVIAAIAVLLPAYRDVRTATVAAARREIGRERAPAWARSGLDVVLLAGGALVVWAASRNGYTLVLAPEGVPSISVAYWAFAGPALLWAGAGLLSWRLADLLLGKGRRLLTAALWPAAGSRLSPTASAMMARRRRPLARSLVLLALALGFAASTATFNATYRAQAEVDAQLTNGADVTVTEPPATTSASAASALSAVRGVQRVEPVQHRFAYIGADLQDLFGVRPDTITGVTSLQDSYFQGGTARELMSRLAARPDSILVSAETVKDYQLLPGALINLRLPDATTHQLRTVPFHYIGIVSEFPTAPKDSFFIANASYIAARTGSDAVGALLVDTGGRDTAAVAQRIRGVVGTGATVTDIGTTRSAVGSSLTAVDLRGLTRVELAFALVLAAAAGGLVLALGLTERRRTFAITTALGATPQQLRRLVAAEVLVVTVGGLIAGGLIAGLLSRTLVSVLTGVFDPPPSLLTVPWSYLGIATVTTLVALALAAASAVRQARRPPTSVLREL